MPDFEAMEERCEAWQPVDKWPNVRACKSNKVKGSRYCAEHKHLGTLTAESPAEGEDLPF